MLLEIAQMFCENLVASLPYCHLRVLFHFLCICVALLCGTGLTAPWRPGLIDFGPLGELWHGCLWSRLVRMTELLARPKSARGRKLPAPTFCQREIVLEQGFQTSLHRAHIRWLFVWQTPWFHESWGGQGVRGGGHDFSTSIICSWHVGWKSFVQEKRNMVFW